MKKYKWRLQRAMEFLSFCCRPGYQMQSAFLKQLFAYECRLMRASQLSLAWDEADRSNFEGDESVLRNTYFNCQLQGDVLTLSKRQPLAAGTPNGTASKKASRKVVWADELTGSWESSGL